jgi:amidase
VGNARPLDQALQHATTEMLDWLETDYGFDTVAASHLMGQTVGYDVGNVFNPAYTVICRMPVSVVEESRVDGKTARRQGTVVATPASASPTLPV